MQKRLDYTIAQYITCVGDLMQLQQMLRAQAYPAAKQLARVETLRATDLDATSSTTNGDNVFRRFAHDPTELSKPSLHSTSQEKRTILGRKFYQFTFPIATNESEHTCPIFQAFAELTIFIIIIDNGDLLCVCVLCVCNTPATCLITDCLLLLVYYTPGIVNKENKQTNKYGLAFLAGTNEIVCFFNFRWLLAVTFKGEKRLDKKGYKVRSVPGLVMQASGNIVEVDILELSESPWSGVG